MTEAKILNMISIESDSDDSPVPQARLIRNKANNMGTFTGK